MNKVILLKKRPVGKPALSDFEFTSDAIPDPMTGNVLLKTSMFQLIRIYVAE
jgi:NADPH-dependent curcumin reductase CurA